MSPSRSAGASKSGAATKLRAPVRASISNKPASSPEIENVRSVPSTSVALIAAGTSVLFSGIETAVSADRTGASLVPVIVTVTVAVSVPPSPSSTV